MVRVGILGAGYVANFGLPALKFARNNEVVGIAAGHRANAEAVARDWDIPLATDDYREVLALKPDLVWVGTPVFLHHEMVLAAAEAGAAILCEKPMALDAAEAEAMVAAAPGLALIDHQLRFNPVRHLFRERLGGIGDLLHGQVVLCLGGHASAHRPWNWWYDRARGGGILGAIGSHLIDLVRFDTGQEVVEVRAELTTFTPRRADAEGVDRVVDVDELAQLWLRLDGGGTLTVTMSGNLPGSESWYTQYFGSNGMVRIDGESHVIGAVGGAHPQPVPTEGLPPVVVDVASRSPFARILPHATRAIVQAVAEGTELPHAATFADGLATQRVLDAARQSHDERRAIRLG